MNDIQYWTAIADDIILEEFLQELYDLIMSVRDYEDTYYFYLASQSLL